MYKCSIYPRAYVPLESYRSLGFANYHLNVFAFSWPQARRAKGFRTSKKEQKLRSLAKESLFLVSLERRSRFSFLSRMLFPSLSYSVDIVTLTYEDRGIRFLCGPYCLLFHHFASRATFVARSYDTCVYLAKLHTM